uniref:SWIM-type domain-containing protein n=1 Tax=Davidia involucrata TaxID=16924 RepID=A0A5B7BJD0_DAVIN
MTRAKLILICQYGGEFVTNDDGSLTYAGGEAHAVNVNRETLFDDLKLKLAEMCNLEYKTMSIKYFLPGNRRTLITLSNDKDLKRMLDFHGNSVTADVFVMGQEGFDRDAVSMYAGRDTGIKFAETVNHIAAWATSSPTDAASPVSLKVAHIVTPTPAALVAFDATSAPTNATPTVTPAAAIFSPAATPTDTVIAVDATARSPAKVTIDSIPSPASADSDDSSTDPRSPVAADAIVHIPIEIDMSATPADTVKKRRRTASWKIGANGPTIVTIADDTGEKRSRKKNSQCQSIVVVANDIEQNQAIVPCKDGSGTLSTFTISDDVSLEKLVASWKDGITGIGQDFKSVYEFRDALQKYAIAHRFVYRLKKNDTNRASGRCVAEGCSWRIHASWVPAAQSFRIKKLNNSHTCGGESWKSAHPTKNWLVSIIKDRLRDSPHHKPKDIANGILQDFGIELNYTQVWRGIEDAREQLQGSYKEAYNQLPCYCEKLVETNPGSFAKLVTTDDKRFQRLFISFHASIHGFQNGCRPLLFLEATSLKSKYQEILLTASAVDGDDGFFLVAFAIVDVENDDNWHWFLEQLKSAVSTSGSITFISDREKGLKEAVLDVFESAHHGYSMYHLMESFKKNLKGPFHGDGKASLPGFFMAAAHAVRLDGFKKFTEQIKRVSSQAYNWIMQIEPEYWTSSSFKGERYNQITENIAESYTTLMEEVRELPIIQKIEALRGMMTELMNTRQMDSIKWPGKLAPSKEEKLQEEIHKAHGLKVLFSSDTLFEVHDESINVVNLDKWDCSCLGWKATGLPCHHAVAVFNCTGRSIYDYCSRYFTVNSFRLTYSESIHPMPGIDKPVEKEETASDTTHVLPPCPSRPPPTPSQQKKKRAKSEGEIKRAVSCTRCKEAGHNKATCKATL